MVEQNSGIHIPTEEELAELKRDADKGRYPHTKSKRNRHQSNRQLAWERTKNIGDISKILNPEKPRLHEPTSPERVRPFVSQDRTTTEPTVADIVKAKNSCLPYLASQADKSQKPQLR